MDYTKGEWAAQGKQIICTNEQNDVIAVAYEHPLMPKGMAEANAHLIAAAPDMYLAGQGLDYAIGSAIIEIAKVTILDESLLNIITTYILPAQENWRKASAKAEGKNV